MTSAPVFYLADTLAPRYPTTAAALTGALTAVGATLQTLPGTRDVWARDYMPVPTPSGQRVLFRYTPDYLRPRRYYTTITDAAAVLYRLDLSFITSPLVVDGGNVVRRFGRVIMTDKVLHENPGIPRHQLLTTLATALETDALHLVPANPDDFTGHADGMVHLLDAHTALVNDCRRREPARWTAIRSALGRAGLECVPLPYNPYRNRTYTSAVGEYLNFLVLPTALIVPIYYQAEDEAVLNCLNRLYPRHTLMTIDGRPLALQGGVFHCATWSPTLTYDSL